MSKNIFIIGEGAVGKRKAVEMLYHTYGYDKHKSSFKIKYYNIDELLKKIFKDLLNIDYDLIIDQLNKDIIRVQEFTQYLNQAYPYLMSMIESRIRTICFPSVDIKLFIMNSNVFNYYMNSSDLYKQEHGWNNFFNWQKDFIIDIKCTEKSIIERNKSLSDRTILDKDFESDYEVYNNYGKYFLHLSPDIKYHFAYRKLFITSGTLLELRSKIEFEIIDCLIRSGLFKFKEILSYFDQLPESFWNEKKNNTYHNKDHTRSVLTNLILRHYKNEGWLDINILLSVIYHDIGYDPKCSKDENIINAFRILDSHKILIENINNNHNVDLKYIKELISDADNLKFNDLLLSDLSHFERTSQEVLEIEYLLFKEYQHVDFNEYRKKHLQVLNDIKTLFFNNIVSDEYRNVVLSEDWIKSFNPRIAWFCGSFNPFHLGHDRILQKAEQMFDKVVIVQLKNPDKNIFNIDIVNSDNFKNEIIFSVDKSVPELINNVGYKPVLICGIRNHNDYDESVAWHQQILMFFPPSYPEKIQLCLIPGNSEYNHITSTFLRECKKVNPKLYNILKK